MFNIIDTDIIMQHKSPTYCNQNDSSINSMPPIKHKGINNRAFTNPCESWDSQAGPAIPHP